MSIGFDPDRIDDLDTSYVAGTVAVTTSAVEAKVGGAALARRQAIILQNAGTNPVYFGPSGVTVSTGVALYPRDRAFLQAGYVPVYLIASTGSNVVTVQELS